MFEIDAKNFVIYHLYPHQKFNKEDSENLLILNESGKVIKIPY